MIVFAIILFTHIFLSEEINNLNLPKTIETVKQLQHDETFQQLNHKNIVFASNQHNRTQIREKRSTGKIACTNGLFCDVGYFCGRFHTDYCFKIGEIECPNSPGSRCPPGYFCSKLRPGNCIQIGHMECPNGAYCKENYFCGKIHSGYCFKIGKIECPHFVGSCTNDEYCGKKQCIPIGHMECLNGNFCKPNYFCSELRPGNCIPIGHMECPDGTYCDPNYFCSKLRPEKCIPIGNTECPDRSCPPDHYCGRKRCIPIGRVECPNGEDSCEKDHYCSQNFSKCIPRGRAECPRANQLGYCRYGEECVRDVCVPEGRQLCPDNVHHCDKETQVCDPTMSIMNPTNSTRGCLFKDVAKCEAYKSMEEKASCGPNGFLLGYGHKYCRRFNAHYYLLDTIEQQILTCISNCLIDGVGHYLKENVPEENINVANLDCDELKSAGKAIQQKCYKSCDLCSLNFTNIHPIWSIITNDLTSRDERRIIAIMCRELGYHQAAHPENNE